jgi:hypothetical protein
MGRALCAATVLGAVTALGTVTSCTSIETGVISDADFVATTGAPQQIIQVTQVGFSLFFGFVDVVSTDLDSTTKLVIAEAKARDASKIEIKSAHTSPRAGIFKVLCALACFPSTEVVGVAVKQ